MPDPLVSIIIPCYNAARWLAATLESALAQTGVTCEVIIVDDGSKDESLAIARGFESRGVQVFAQANRGASAARNRGLQAARGKFVQFLDSDDLLAPDKIARQLDVLQHAPPGTIASGPWGKFSGDTASARFDIEPVWTDQSPLDWLVRSWGGGGMFPPIVWLTPRAALDAAGPWDESLSLDDDGEYFCRVLLQCSVIRFVAGANSYYRIHDGPRLSGSRGGRAAASSFASAQSKERHALAREDSPRMRHALAINWQRYVWEQIADAPELAAKAFDRAEALDPGLPPPDGPRSYRWAIPVVGWRRARRLHLAAQRLLRR